MNNIIPHPQVTVIMPVYNAEKYIHNAIDSIVKQTFSDFEFLIFDDGSTDSSTEIILSFQDPRIQLIASPLNTGYVKHLNDGLLQAKGQYIARMDADDIADPDRFIKQINYLNQHEEIAACGSWIEFVGSRTGILEYPVCHQDIVTHLFLYGNVMAHPSVMLRKSVLTAYGLSYDTSLEPAEDYQLWNDIAAVARLHNIPEVLLKYRVHDQNESVLKKAKQDQAVLVIRMQMIKKVLSHPTDKVCAFILNQNIARINDQDLIDIQVAVLSILNSGKYDQLKLKTEWTNRFIAWCLASNLNGFSKLMHYIRFPKHFFSLRICLSLLINKR